MQGVSVFRILGGWFLILVLVAGFAPPVHGTDLERESLSLLYEPESVVTATRLSEPAIESPAIMSVITGQQIRALGVNTLPELL
ncbi:MAG TPA: hypothetical protein PKM25_09210, partial [Candidatus Ozemobacteraceae bacterium]|nr:hypothetical protein [Candidatus Ozemobacteraceae bacterium]